MPAVYHRLMRTSPVALALLIIILAVYGWNVAQHAFLCDDAFISFRYAKHLADGEGLVWNPGERVEGYTNYLWVVLMAASLKVGVPPEVSSQVLGVASGVAVLGLMLAFLGRRYGFKNPVTWLVPVVLACSRTFAAWSTSGLETMFFALLVLAGFLALLLEREHGVTVPWRSALLFVLASLTRPEGALFAAVAGAFLLVNVVRGRRGVRALLLWAAIYIPAVGVYLLWRHSYYGFWLPNTFYAKVPGPRVGFGLHYLHVFHLYYQIAWFVPLIALTIAKRRDAVVLLFLAVTIAYLAYVVAVGGDFMDLRFLVVVLPFLYVLIADGLARVWRLEQRGTAAFVTAVAVALLLTTLIGSRATLTHNQRGGVSELASLVKYGRVRTEQGKFLRDAIDAGKLPADVVLGAGGVGAIPYYTEWETIDFRGLNDLEVARMPVGDRNATPGHERLAPIEYLWERGVEMLDADNMIVHDTPSTKLGGPLKYGGRQLMTRVYELDGKYLIFATNLSDEAFARRFPHLELLTAPGQRRTR